MRIAKYYIIANVEQYGTKISNGTLPSSGKRDRSAAFGTNSVLEALPSQDKEILPPNAQSLEGEVLAEPPPKLQRIDSDEEKKDDASAANDKISEELPDPMTIKRKARVVSSQLLI